MKRGKNLQHGFKNWKTGSSDRKNEILCDITN